MSTRTGGCQCGELRYEITGEPIAVAACHCKDCQCQSGSAFSMSMLVKRQDFRWMSGEAVSFTTKADSGARKDGVFCPTCGVRIYNALSSMPATWNVKAGTLDDTGGIEPAMHVWLSRKQHWVLLPEGSRQFQKNPGRTEAA
jgi:hypothetical protein